MMGDTSGWFPSAAAAVTALLAATALSTKRPAWPPVRAGLSVLAWAVYTPKSVSCWACS